MRIVPYGEREADGERRVPAWFVHALMLGLYLTARGYHSFDGDQAYRLPLLLHQQDPSRYEEDPFVRSFDTFNPHRGSLIVLDVVTRGLGLPAGLFVLFVLTFLLTCRAVERLGRAVWPDSGPNVGWIAVTLLLAAKAGNIGTNHLFEAMVLDRLLALALGWQALAMAISSPEHGWWRSSAAIGLATWIHPSAGLQLAMVLGASWLAWSLLGRWMEVNPGTAIRSLAALMLAVLPGLAVNVPRGESLLGALPENVFWLLSVELQSPQHMLPHLWRMPQWLSWSCYLTLAALQLGSGGFTRALQDRVAYVRGTPPNTPLTKAGPGGVYSRCPPARRRLAVSLGVILVGLGVAWFAIEVLHQVRVTIFQPFRMATLARGMALILIAGRLVALWRSGDALKSRSSDRAGHRLPRRLAAGGRDFG